VHLVGTVHDMQGATMRPHGGQREIIAHARAAKELDGTIDDIGVHLGTAILIMAISFCAAFLPRLSIIQAA